MRSDPHPTTTSRPTVVVDAGTTRTKVALATEGALVRLGAFPSGHRADRWWAHFVRVLARAGLGTERRHIDHVVVSCVVASASDALRAMPGRIDRAAPVRFVAAASAPLTVDYRPVDDLGADRIADAVAAMAGWGAPVVVVDVGTAITCDLVSAGGRFSGGAIAPGPATAHRGLVERIPRLAGTARLGDLAAAGGEAGDGDLPLVGTSTEECLRIGALRGAAALVDGLARGHQRLMGPCPVVATGGLAPAVARLSETVTAVDPDLTLRGVLLACAPDQVTRDTVLA